MSRHDPPSTGAFTLIELLVVIAIVAVLAGILLPVVDAVRSAARGSVCAGNQRQISLAVSAYAGEWDGILPLSLMVVGTVPADWGYPAGQDGAWTDPPCVGAHLEDPPVLGGHFQGGRRQGVLTCPEDRRIQGPLGWWATMYVSYGLNIHLCPSISANTPADIAAAWRKSTPLSHLRRACEVVLSVDTQEARYHPGNGSPGVPPFYPVGDQTQPPTWVSTFVQNPFSAYGRHRGAVTLGFADGRVASTRSLPEDIKERRVYVRLADVL